MEKEVNKPTDPGDLEAYEKKDNKAQRVILDVVKDHLIPHVAEKMSAAKMFKSMKNLFQSDNMNMKMILKNKVRDACMSRSNIVTNYLMRMIHPYT